MKASGACVFLATNSDFPYTNAVMSYLFEGQVGSCIHTYIHTYAHVLQFLFLHFMYVYMQGDWKTHFTFVVVSARKPLFFEDGSVLREVDQVLCICLTNQNEGMG